MKHSKYITFISLLLISIPSMALNLVEMNQQIEIDLYDNRSCNYLYMQAKSVEKNLFAYEANHGSKTQLASVMTTLFAPAVYYLGYSAFYDYKNSMSAKAVFTEIEDIRFRMAEKQCFTK